MAPPRPENTPSPRVAYRVRRWVRQLDGGSGCSKAVLSEKPGSRPLALWNGWLRGFRALLGMGSGAVADGFQGERSLLADAVGDFREFPGVGTDCREVVHLAYEVEGAQGFPDLFVAGVHRGNLRSGGHGRSGSDRDGVNPAADGGAQLRGLSALRSE